MTCRDLSKSKIGRCYYCPIIDDAGNLVNDPVVLKLAEDKWWISIADSDVIFFAKGLASGYNFDVKIIEPIVDIMAVQGPKSFELMKRIFGSDILNLKFFHFQRFDFRGHPFLIARSGWSKQGGFEIYVDHDDLGLQLYDQLIKEGQDLNARPGCPNLIERIESGLLSYGNDMDMNDTPLECGLDSYVSFNPEIEYLGKVSLQKQKDEGVTRSLVGLILDLEEISLTQYLPIMTQGQMIGTLRSACFSPNFNKCLGIAMVDKPYQNFEHDISLFINGNEISAKMTNLPFTK